MFSFIIYIFNLLLNYDFYFFHFNLLTLCYIIYLIHIHLYNVEVDNTLFFNYNK